MRNVKVLDKNKLTVSENKVYGYIHFQGKQLYHFSFISAISVIQHLKTRFCSSWSTIIPIRLDPFLKGFVFKKKKKKSK